MQRRAAAVYFTLFVLVGAASYSLIAVAEEPEIALDAPEYGEGDRLTVDGRTYTVASLSVETASEGGHGGGGTTYSGELTWVNASAQYTAGLENDSTVTYRDDEWRVLIPNRSSPGRFTLRQEQNVSTILADDPDVADELVTRDGERYVLYTANDTIAPLSGYLPAPEERSFARGDRFEYRGNTTTVGSIAPEEVTLVWEGEKTNTVSLSQGSNVTLNGERYLAYFPGGDTVQLSPNPGAYREQVRIQDRFHERENGLWGVTILSGLASIMLVGIAYLPVKG